MSISKILILKNSKMKRKKIRKLKFQQKKYKLKHKLNPNQMSKKWKSINKTTRKKNLNLQMQ